MEPVGEKTVFNEHHQDVKLYDLQKKEEKAQIKAFKDEKSPLQKLISYVEIGGILLALSYFKKPLLSIASKVGKDIETEAIKVTSEVVDAIEGAEMILRKAIIESLLLDPILCYKIGGNVYNELVYNAEWNGSSENIYYTNGPIPSTVSNTFVIGTGSGATTVNASYVRGLSIQILASLEYLIASGRDLN